MRDEAAQRLVPLRPEGSGPPLFCVHAVSGSAYSYAGLARLLPDGVPVYGIEAPGFDDGRSTPDAIPALVDDYCALLRAACPEGGLRLLGWSMGGILAYETALRLAAEGIGVDRIVLVDSGLPWLGPPAPEREIQRSFLHDLAGLFGAGHEQVDKVLAALPEEADAQACFAAVEEADPGLGGLDADLLGERYAVFRALRRAMSTFEVTGHYDGPVTHVIAEGSRHWWYMDWSALASGLTEQVLPGDHYSMWGEQGLAALAALVAEALGE